MAKQRSKPRLPAPEIAPRLAAFDVLRAVLARRRPLDEALAASERFTALSDSERAFASFIVRTALRRLGQLDALLAHCIETPLPKKAQPVMDVLRVGAAQLLFSATAAHAAVATTVDLCRAAGQQPFAKLVNAVMRRLQREGETLVQAQDAARLNTPGWLWDTWCAAYGEDATRAIAEQHLETPPLDLTVKNDADGWAERLFGTALLGGTVRLSEAPPVPALEGFAEGGWWVQDAAARLPAMMLGDVAGKQIIDLCAAPGGKTLVLAAAGADVTAVDISENRLARVRENLERTGLAATTVAADVRDWRPDGPADAVLLDAPCSATGTARRHPDVLHLKTPADVAKLAGVQDALLDAAATMLKPGGVLVYATCSLQPDEGPERIAAFLARTPGFRRKPLGADELPGLPEARTADGDLRTLPCHLAVEGGMDGFFAARLEKVGP